MSTKRFALGTFVVDGGAPFLGLVVDDDVVLAHGEVSLQRAAADLRHDTSLLLASYPGDLSP